MAFDAGGTIVFSYTDGTERWELRVPCAEFDPTSFAYTGTGLKVPTEADIAATVANFGGVWAPYFDPTWTLTLEALFHTSGGTGTRLDSLPSVADVTGTSRTPSSANPPLMRGFSFTLDNGRRQVVRFFSVATTTTGARREVTATSGGFDSRDQALMAYLAGPSTGLVAWDGQIFPPSATAYQRYKLAPFERGGGGGGSSPPADCITFPRGASMCNDAADVVHVRTPGATHALDLTGYTLPGGGRIDRSLSASVFPRSMQGDLNIVDDGDLVHQPPQGDYSLVCTLHTADFESEPLGGIGHISAGPPGSGGPFTTQVAVNPAFSPFFSIGAPLPAPFTAISWYIVPYPFADPPPGVLGKFATTATNEWVYISAGDGTSPPATDASRTAIMRLLHDGSSLDVTLPFTTLSVAPDLLMGKNPATGVPAFCPAPVSTMTTVMLGGGGGSLSAPPSACVQVRCGVSAVLRDHLFSLYQDWSTWLDPLFQACAALGVSVAVASISWDWIADLGLAAAGDAIKGGVISLLFSFGSAITGNLLPTLDLDLERQIQQAAFDTLACTADQVQVSAANITAWQAALNALTTWPISSLAGPFCGLLLQFTPLAAWQGAAASASPSHACDAWP